MFEGAMWLAYRKYGPISSYQSLSARQRKIWNAFHNWVLDEIVPLGQLFMKFLSVLWLEGREIFYTPAANLLAKNKYFSGNSIYKNWRFCAYV